eukprot:943313-Pleurochrysis_carterae.AAC.1
MHAWSPRDGGICRFAPLALLLSLLTAPALAIALCVVCFLPLLSALLARGFTILPVLATAGA